jgi:hypothetical protein
MAILKGPMKLEGRVGDLIFYRRGNKTCCRSMPAYKPGSMTAASKQSAGEFGQASKAGKLFRQALSGLWPIPQDSGMVNRLNKTMYSALRADPHPRGQRVITPAALKEALKNFRLNNKAVPNIQVSCTREKGQLRILLPEDWVQRLKSPRYASHVQVQVAALVMDAATGACRKVATVTDCVALDASHTGVLPLLQSPPDPRLTTVVVLQLRFIKEEANGQIYSSAEKTGMLSCIIEVLLPEKKLKPAPGKQPSSRIPAALPGKQPVAIAGKKPGVVEALAAPPGPKTSAHAPQNRSFHESPS